MLKAVISLENYPLKFPNHFLTFGAPNGPSLGPYRRVSDSWNCGHCHGLPENYHSPKQQRLRGEVLTFDFKNMASLQATGVVNAGAEAWSCGLGLRALGLYPFVAGHTGAVNAGAEEWLR